LVCAVNRTGSNKINKPVENSFFILLVLKCDLKLIKTKKLK
jgi:hypothetical protein